MPTTRARFLVQYETQWLGATFLVSGVAFAVANHNDSRSNVGRVGIAVAALGFAIFHTRRDNVLEAAANGLRLTRRYRLAGLGATLSRAPLESAILRIESRRAGVYRVVGRAKGRDIVIGEGGHELLDACRDATKLGVAFEASDATLLGMDAIDRRTLNLIPPFGPP